MFDNVILSLYYGEHDSCITFADHEKILLHLEAERYFRIKHLRASPQQMEKLIDAGLKYLGKTVSNIEKVYLSIWGLGEDVPIYNMSFQGKNFIPILTSHHLSHIGTVLPSKFEDALIICADGGSEDGTTKVYLKKPDKILFLEDLGNTILTGKFYGTITQMIIDPDFHKAHESFPGKTMGLAALGSFSKEFQKLILNNSDALNRLYFDGCSHLNDLFGISHNFKDVWKDKRRRDLAYTAQKIWVDEFIKTISGFKLMSKNICLAGGCALNVVLNSALAKTGWFENVFISPISGDGGQSLGAILYHHPEIKCDYPFLGRSFGDIQMKNYDVNQVVNDLIDHKIVAWYQGRGAVGARALGHRSFLGIPDSIKMRKKLSEKIKGREPYRPVAAIMTEEFLPHFTTELAESPFMTFAPQVKKSIKENIPAIVHFDGTSRIQTLKRNNNPILHRILTKIGEKTGFPVLMNSSFNVAGEPIVSTPQDAINTFKKSLADVLYINGKRITNLVFSGLIFLPALSSVSESCLDIG